MVAPHEIGDPVRSLVRIPGSGHAPANGAILCDLARVSSLANAVQISPLPAALSGVKPNETTGNFGVPHSSNRKPPAENGSTSLSDGINVTTCSNIENKRKRSLETGDATSPRQPPVKTICRVASNAAGRSVIPSPMSADAQQLALDQLREENKMLRRQVSIFQQLFRNPERLASLLHNKPAVTVR